MPEHDNTAAARAATTLTDGNQESFAALAQTEADNYARNHAEQAKSKTTKTGE